MRSRRSSGKSKPLEDSVQTNESQQMSGTMGNQAALQTMGMGGASPQSAIPVGTDSPSGMTGAPNQAQKKGPMAKRKQRKAQQAAYDAVGDQRRATYMDSVNEAKAAAEADPNNEYLRYRSMFLDRGAGGALSNHASMTVLSSEKVFNACNATNPIIDRYGSANYARDSAHMLTPLDSAQAPAREALVDFSDNEFLLANGRHRGEGSSHEGAQATQEEVSLAYIKSCDTYLTQAEDVMAFVNSHSKFFNNHNLSPADTSEAAVTQTVLNLKAQQVISGVRSRMNDGEYHKLDPALKTKLFETAVQMESLEIVRTNMRVFNSTAADSGVESAHKWLETSQHMTLKEVNLDNIMERTRRMMGDANNPQKPNWE